VKVATFNVLADEYIRSGDYSHVDPELLLPGARDKLIFGLVSKLGADVVGLQEVNQGLREVFESDARWQTFWSPKGANKPDGCLTLVSSGLKIANHESHKYDDDSGHVFKITRIGRLAIANTHIKWALVEDPNHVGVLQMQQILNKLNDCESAVILADCNDKPDGPVQQLVRGAGFTSLSADRPTALVDQEQVAIDLIAVRGVVARLCETNYSPYSIPSESCPSDHMPMLAEVQLV
jgi:endonuclease/exonuclease/phosphatase family metal-dependent hydrolase